MKNSRLHTITERTKHCRTLRNPPTIRKTNRAPFDLTEWKSELVSDFNIEYAAGPFALFFMAEYINIILINALST
ncbi:hypothetical protein U0070_019847, partial [Myodes glareolus]